MIKDNSQYLYLIVPNEYRCVYYNILDTLGTLGEDLLSSCTATCKGRAITGFACYNMFNAACACYHLGFIKRARVLISYIKAQLEISCNKFVVHENSAKDEFVYLRVPVVYEQTFECLLNNLATYGQELLDDCSVSCKGKNKNLVNCWNLFQAAILAYDGGNEYKANKIIDYINDIFDIGGTKYFTISVNCIPQDATVQINGATTKTLTIAKNESCLVVVSKEGYKTYRNEFTVTENKTINVTLEEDTERLFTVNLNVLPESAQNKQAIITNKQTGETYMATGQFKAGTKLILSASAETYTPVQQEYTVNAADAVNGVITKNIQLVKKATVQVEVRVFSDSSYTNPLSDCTVKLINAITQSELNPDSTMGGIYSFRNVPVGNYSVQATKQGYTQKILQSYVIDDNKTINVWMEADASTTHRFTFNIIDDISESVINDATVYIDGSQVSGTYADLTPGSHDILIQKTGYSALQESFTINQDTTKTYRLRNYVPVTFNISKEDVSGAAGRTGVTVVYTLGSSQTEIPVTNDNSTTHNIPFGQLVTVKASASGYETTIYTKTFNAAEYDTGDDDNIAFTLPRLYTINAIAVDSQSGNEISGATVTITEDND